MKNHKERWCALLLACLLTFGMAGCGQDTQQAESESNTTQQTQEQTESQQTESQQTEETAETETADSSTQMSYSRSAQEIAEDFTQTWASKWIAIEEDGVTSTMTGCGFLADLDGDGLGELIFLYDNDIHYDAVVYRVSGNSAEELGSFTLSNTSPELHFTIFDGSEGSILRHVAVRELSGQSGSETEESYITLEDGKVLQEILFSTTYDGVDTYYDSIVAGAQEISLEEFDAMRDELLSGAEESGTVTFTAGDFIDFSDTETLTEYIAGLFTA